MTGDSDVTIEFKGRHDHITERMQAHAARKLARLARFQDRLVRIEVVADHAHKNPEVELIVHQRRGAPLVAKDRGTSFSATIDLLVDKMEAQLRKLKDKRKDHKVQNGKELRSGARGAAGTGRRRGGDDEETYEQAVRRTLRG
ncbi:MAG: ribosome-associated translation inhibitor RaiA [Planctomycetes bacterium]|nr:ribosome-associated translation inhibitor RaiA [Planctomycetota bacterium]